MSDYTLTERQKHLYRESKLLYDKYPEYHSSVKVIDNKKDLGGSYYKGRIKSSLREVIGHS